MPESLDQRPREGNEPTIVVRSLSKKFHAVHAVNEISFTVAPGRITGFLGPNGAGKTTTLRMLLGLTRPSSGTATIHGHNYLDLPQPTRRVGAALEADTFHPGRTAADHLRVFAPAAGASDQWCRELLDVVGLTEAADRRVGGFSTGMRQRLALATALLGDPDTLILDEPTNGLDPAGIAWLRTFLRRFADQGRTVLVSSHVLSEMQLFVDDVVIIARGELVHASTLADLGALAVPQVTVSSPDAAGLAALIAKHDWQADPSTATTNNGWATVVYRVSAAEVGSAAFNAGLELYDLHGQAPGLEDVFFQLVADPTPGEAAPSGHIDEKGLQA